jgi:hypothetical protein
VHAQKSKYSSQTKAVLQAPAVYSEDTIEAYLAVAPVSHTDVEAAGGVLAYWVRAKAQRPRLAKFALKYLSVPGMSAPYCELETDHLP